MSDLPVGKEVARRVFKCTVMDVDAAAFEAAAQAGDIKIEIIEVRAKFIKLRIWDSSSPTLTSKDIFLTARQSPSDSTTVCAYADTAAEWQALQPYCQALWDKLDGDESPPHTKSEVGQAVNPKTKRTSDGPSDKIRKRFEVCKRLKTAHPTWTYEKVAIKATEELGEEVTGTDIRNDFRRMGEPWQRGDVSR